MSSHFVTIVSFVALVCLGFHVHGQVPFMGKCPNYPVVENFQVDEYLGHWYEIEKYFSVFESGGMCIQAYYFKRDNGTIGLTNTQIKQKNGKIKAIQGTARPIADDGSARFAVTFDSLPLLPEAPYYVAATDYKNYSIVWSCNDYAVFNFQIVWFLARDSNPSAELTNEVHEKMNQIGIRRDLLIPTNQTNCESS